MISIVHSMLHANKQLNSLQVRINQIENLSNCFGSLHNPCTLIGIYRNYFANDLYGENRIKCMCGTFEELVEMAIEKSQIFDRFSLTVEHTRVN